MKWNDLLRILLVVMFSGMLVGCEDLVDAASESVDDIAAEVEAAAEATDDDTDATDDDDDATTGNSTFLWKPISETRGQVCVVIFPYYIRQEDTTYTISINGDTGQVKDWREGYANGNRMHVFLNSPGSTYGGAVTVSLPMADGSTRTWYVPDGGTRYETHDTGE